MSDELRPPPPRWEEGEEPKAVIERVGRWTYSVHIEHGFMQDYAGQTVVGFEHAKRVAQERLQHYRRDLTRQTERWEIT
jgi:hypothetical protein